MELLLRKISKMVLTLVKYLIFIITVIVLIISIVAGINLIQEKLFVPNKYLMWMFKSPFNHLVFVYEYYIIGLIVLVCPVFRLNNYISEISKIAIILIKKYRVIFVIANMAMLYVIIFDVTIVTKDKIIDYSAIRPLGKVYSYSDVVKVDTGFSEKKHKFGPRKGEFYYYIKLKDNTKVNLNDIGGVYDDNVETYSEIEMVDKDLMKLGLRNLLHQII